MFPGFLCFDPKHLAVDPRARRIAASTTARIVGASRYPQSTPPTRPIPILIFRKIQMLAFFL